MFLAEALMDIVGQLGPRQWAEDKQGKNTKIFSLGSISKSLVA